MLHPKFTISAMNLRVFFVVVVVVLLLLLLLMFFCCFFFLFFSFYFFMVMFPILPFAGFVFFDSFDFAECLVTWLKLVPVIKF